MTFEFLNYCPVMRRRASSASSPARLVHTYEVEESAQLMGIPQFPGAMAIAQSHRTQLMPDFDWPQAQQ
jgi:hypothetical protein